MLDCSVADPKLLNSDPDPTFQSISDPDPDLILDNIGSGSDFIPFADPDPDPFRIQHISLYEKKFTFFQVFFPA